VTSLVEVLTAKTEELPATLSILKTVPFDVEGCTVRFSNVASVALIEEASIWLSLNIL
jgi:hypothetical protein